MNARRPLVTVVGQGGSKDGLACDVLEEPYSRALLETAGVTPLLLPRRFPLDALGDLVETVDGVVLTGDVSNIEPWRYGAPRRAGRGPFDPARDGLALALVAEARRRAIPLLGICRGHEETNVAYGGTLWSAVHEQPGFLDHREPEDPDPGVRYRPAHEVRFVPGGLLATVTGTGAARVNSLHGQGIRDLGAELVAEALAPDGLVEAVRDTSGGRWVLGVQWHPEWNAAQDGVSRRLFEAFGRACTNRHRP